DEEFALAQAGQGSRRNRSRGRAAREAKYVNVFKGLLVHARDGEGFLLHNKGTTKAPAPVLLNARGNAGRGRGYTFPYFVFEEAILGRLREVDAREVLPKGDQAPDRVAVLRAELANVRGDVARLQGDLRAGYSKALVSVLRDLEALEEHKAQALQEELARA